MKMFTTAVISSSKTGDHKLKMRGLSLSTCVNSMFHEEIMMDSNSTCNISFAVYADP